MFKKLNKKGFTLAELLIVVAIIGVLVAISIPIFSSQLEKAREATDLANLRAAYAEGSAALLDGDYETDSASWGTYTAGSTTSLTGWYDIGTGKITQTKVAAGKGTEAKTNNTGITVGGFAYKTNEDYTGKGIEVTLDLTKDQCTVKFESIS
ncbi:MAG: prepilin-type N-terminal cleavage/methylation domain-containing protein [Oribacterium sp.]|nr:prepilin-type N-terminal cleavage/methylation domain-containing protein [Oribacterium sp.]